MSTIGMLHSKWLGGFNGRGMWLELSKQRRACERQPIARNSCERCCCQYSTGALTLLRATAAVAMMLTAAKVAVDLQQLKQAGIQGLRR